MHSLMTGSSLFIGIIGLVMALWLVCAAVAIYYGLSLRRAAMKTIRQTARLSRLLETSPSVPVVVRSNGRIDASDRFSKLIGQSSLPQSLADLNNIGDQGILASDLAELEQNIREAQRCGKSFKQAINLNGSKRKLMVIGNVADPLVYPNGAALLWFFDSTQNLSALEDIRVEAEQSKAAFSALSALIEESPVPIWHRNPDLRLNFVNRAYVVAVGAESAEQVIAQGIELIEEVGGASAMAFAAKAISSKQPIERVVASTIAGERRQMRVFDIPLVDAGVSGIAIDIQDLVDSRLEFKRLSGAQRDLLNMMSAGVVQFDADHNLSFANLPFQRLFAFRDTWLNEKIEFARVLDRMRENGRLPEVRDFPLWRTECENWFRSAEPVEESWLLADGTHLRVLAQPVPDGGLLLIFEDRTEHVQLASAHDTLLRVRTATFDNLFEAIAVFAADGRISIWNRIFAEIWSLEAGQLSNHPRVDELLPILAGNLKKPSQVSVLAEIIRMTTASREPRRSKLVFKDDRIFQISTVPLPDGNALLAMLDISGSAQIERALRDRNAALSEADSIKGRFLANMSYEFRTPLTSISGFADLLLAGIGGEMTDQSREYVGAIAISAERLSQQINTVLDYSQSEAGALPIARQPVDIADMLARCVDKLTAANADNSKNLNIEIAKEVGLVTGDNFRLQQAIGQILDNAVRHGGPGVAIDLRAKGSASIVEISVQDNGPGIADEVPLEASVQQKGLGLALAKQLIESHGGKIEIKSLKDRGTTVRITLPRA
jgi:signal transduction histidine kinase